MIAKTKKTMAVISARFFTPGVAMLRADDATLEGNLHFGKTSRARSRAYAAARRIARAMSSSGIRHFCVGVSEHANKDFPAHGSINLRRNAAPAEEENP